MCHKKALRVVAGIATGGLSEVAIATGAVSPEIVSRTTAAIGTGGLSEVSRATGIPVDPITIGRDLAELGKTGLEAAKELRDPTPAPTAATPTPQAAQTPARAARESNVELTNQLRRRRRGDASQRRNLGSTLLTGTRGVKDEDFITPASLLGGG